MNKKQFFIFIAGGIAISLIAFWVFRFSGREHYKAEHYKAMFKEAPGLKIGTKVTTLGIRVGLINALTIRNDSVEAKFWVKGIKLRQGATFSLEPSNLFGDKDLIIHNGNGEVLPCYSTIYGSSKQGLGEAIVYLGKFLEHLDSLTNQMLFLTAETQKSFDATAKGLDKTVSSVEEEAVATLKSVREIATSTQGVIAKSTEDIKTTIENFKNVSSSLKNLLASVDTSLIVTLYSVSRTIAQLDTLSSFLLAGKGTAGKLMASDSLYNELNSTLNSLQQLIDDIKKDPHRYFSVFQ